MKVSAREPRRKQHEACPPGTRHFPRKSVSHGQRTHDVSQDGDHGRVDGDPELRHHARQSSGHGGGDRGLMRRSGQKATQDQWH